MSIILNINIVRLRNGSRKRVEVPSVIMVRGRPRDCPRDFSPDFSLKTKWRWVRKKDGSERLTLEAF